MLEKQKEWCKEKTEKGMKWIKENKFAIGFSAGCVGCFIVTMIHDKIFESKATEIGLYAVKNEDGTWSDDFGIETYGINRFGKEKRGYRVVFEQSDADWLTEHIQKAVNVINEHNKN